MQEIFARVDLAFDPARALAHRKSMRELQGKLLGSSALFTMWPPVFRPETTPYYHEAYTAAAFDGAPRLGKFLNLSDKRLNAWWPAITEHLQTFAMLPETHRLIGQALATHYGRVAEAAVDMPWLSSQPLIHGKRRPDGIEPLRLFGATGGNLAVANSAEVKDQKEAGRQYFDLRAVASAVGWTIPGIDDPDTKAAIREAFADARNADLPVAPESLFMLGRLVVERRPGPSMDAVFAAQ